MKFYFCNKCKNIVPESDIIIDPYNYEDLNAHQCPYCRKNNTFIELRKDNILEIPEFPFKVKSSLKLNTKGIEATDLAIRELIKKNIYYIEDYIFSTVNNEWLAVIRYVGESISSSTYTISINELKENYNLWEK